MVDRKADGVVIRDDNLRLIFRRAISADLNERQIDVLSGFVLVIIFDIAVFAALALTFAFGDGGADGAIGALFALLLGLAGVTALLSPVIVIMLIVEFVRVSRERQEFKQLLNRYGRSSDE